MCNVAGHFKKWIKLGLAQPIDHPGTNKLHLHYGIGC